MTPLETLKKLGDARGGPLLAALGPLLAALGPLLGRSWPLLGLSWAALGRSWAALRPLLGALGRSWALLGRSWGALGPHLESSWALLGAPGPPWGDLYWIFNPQRVHFGASRGGFSSLQSARTMSQAGRQTHVAKQKLDEST